MMSRIVFNILFKSKTDGLVESHSFTVGNGGGSGVAQGLVLQAVYPANASRYFLTLVLNGTQVIPAPPLNGFGSISEMMAWINNNWYAFGTWTLLFAQNKLVLNVPASIATNGSLEIIGTTNTLTAYIPILLSNESYFVEFTNGVPLFPSETVTTPGGILAWVQDNWAAYGQWSIESGYLVLNGSVDLTGLSLIVHGTTVGGFSIGFNTGFNS